MTLDTITTNVTSHYARLIQEWNEEEFVILIPSYILVVVVLIIGIPGNIITLLVYTTKMRRTPPRIFILALTYSDLFNCCVTMPMEISIMVRFWSFDFPVICAGVHTFTCMMNSFASLLLCGIAVDRFRKICRPLKPKFSTKHVRSICFFALGVSALSIPVGVIYGTRTANKISNNVTLEGETCQISDKHEKSNTRKYITGIWFLAILSVMVFLTFIYLRIGRSIYTRHRIENQRQKAFIDSLPKPNQTVRRHIEEQSIESNFSIGNTMDTAQPVNTGKQKERKQIKALFVPVQVQDNENQSASTLHKSATVLVDRSLRRIHIGRTTVVLLSVTIAYVLSLVPFVIIVVIRASKPTFYETLSDAEKSIWNLFLRSYVINCAVNSFLYGLFNKNFRMKMVELFEKKTRRAV